MLNYFKAKLSKIKRALNPYTYFASRQNVCDVMELVDLEVTKKLGHAYWRSEDCWKLIADLRLRYEQDIHQLQKKIIWLKSENTKNKKRCKKNAEDFEVWLSRAGEDRKELEEHNKKIEEENDKKIKSLHSKLDRYFKLVEGADELKEQESRIIKAINTLDKRFSDFENNLTGLRENFQGALTVHAQSEIAKMRSFVAEFKHDYSRR